MFVSVDLPIPGEPPSSTSEPGTRPPPSTRSSSPIPVDIRFTGAAPTSPSGIGTGLGETRRRRTPAPPARARRPARAPCARVDARRSSTSVFHSPHSGHWPCHWADWKPHCEQTWTVVRGIAPEYVPAGTAQST